MYEFKLCELMEGALDGVVIPLAHLRINKMNEKILMNNNF